MVKSCSAVNCKNRDTPKNRETPKKSIQTSTDTDNASTSTSSCDNASMTSSCVDSSRKSFHAFPKDEYMRRLWVSAVKRVGFNPSNSAVICSDHFLETDYRQTMKHNRLCLKSNAVPFGKSVKERKVIKKKPLKILKKKVIVKKEKLKKERLKKGPATPGQLALKKRIKVFQQKVRRRRKKLLAMHVNETKSNIDEKCRDHLFLQPVQDFSFTDVKSEHPNMVCTLVRTEENNPEYFDQPENTETLIHSMSNTIKSSSTLVKKEVTSLNIDSGENLDVSLSFCNAEQSSEVQSTRGYLPKKSSPDQPSMIKPLMNQLTSTIDPLNYDFDYSSLKKALAIEKSNLAEQITSKLIHAEYEFYINNILSDVLECVDLSFDKLEHYIERCKLLEKVQRKTIGDEKQLECENAKLKEFDDLIKIQRKIIKNTNKEDFTEAFSLVQSNVIKSNQTCVICKTDFNCTLKDFKKHLSTHLVYEMNTNKILSFDGNILITEEKDVDIPVKDMLQKSHISLKDFTHCCLICNLKYMKFKQLRLHKRAKHTCKDSKFDTENLNIFKPERKNICQKCGKLFSKFTTLTQHLEWHENEHQHQCDVCGVEFASKKSLKKHTKYLHAVDNQGNPVRPRTKTNRKLDHTQSVKGDLFKCSECYKVFKHRLSCQMHIKLKHDGLGPKPYACNSCGKGFSTKYVRDSHFKALHLGERPCCKVCNKTFAFHVTLRNHMKIHTEERPHECDVCQQKFRRPDSLRQHKLIHTGEKPWPCRVCGVMFRQRSDRGTHEKRHIKRGEATKEDLVKAETETSGQPRGSTHIDGHLGHLGGSTHSGQPKGLTLSNLSNGQPVRSTHSDGIPVEIPSTEGFYIEIVEACTSIAQSK